MGNKSNSEKEIEPIQVRQHLDRFLTDNEDLERLSARLGAINFFSILRIEDHEIRHSNLIAWLFDPAGSHGLGDTFLKGILARVLLDTERTVAVSAAEVQMMDFRNARVRREDNHTDVLVRDDSNRLVVLLENKVRAGESAGQLARYLKRVKEEVPGSRVISLFLTLDGADSSDDEAREFISCTYGQVLEVLSRTIERHRGRLNQAALIFLDHYLEILRRELMEDKDLVELCKSIYSKHREAIDLINRYGKVDKFTEAATAAVSNGAYKILYDGATHFCFIPNRWLELLPENGAAYEHDPNVSVQCFFNRNEDKVWLKFEVSQMTDPKLRMRCVEELRKAGFKLTEAAFREDAKYSRFYNASVRIESEDRLQDSFEQLIREASDHFSKAESVFKKVFKK